MAQPRNTVRSDRVHESVHYSRGGRSDRLKLLGDGWRGVEGGDSIAQISSVREVVEACARVTCQTHRSIVPLFHHREHCTGLRGVD